jgi:hypothetical protein
MFLVLLLLLGFSAVTVACCLWPCGFAVAFKFWQLWQLWQFWQLWQSSRLLKKEPEW